MGKFQAIADVDYFLVTPEEPALLFTLASRLTSVSVVCRSLLSAEEFLDGFTESSEC